MSGREITNFYKQSAQIFVKYIPLVKHTSWTTILPIPPVAFSLTKLPIKIPKEINNKEIIRDTNIETIILKLKFKPRITATIKNNISWIRTIGNKASIYPKI